MNKKPQPGEWWRRRDGGIAYVVGRRPECDYTEWPLIVIDLYGGCREPYTEDGFLDESHVPCDEDLIEHLPECTGWDWVPEVQAKQNPSVRHSLEMLASIFGIDSLGVDSVDLADMLAQQIRSDVPVPVKTKIPLRVWVSRNVATYPEDAYNLKVSSGLMRDDCEDYAEVHGLQIYIEDPLASGSVDDTE
jgi:hypothetical protein